MLLEEIEGIGEEYRERLRAYVRHHPITKIEMSRLIGISPITLIRILDGGTMKPSTLYKLEKFFDAHGVK